MAALLALSRSPELLLTVDRLARAQSFRPMTTTDFETARKWLSLRPCEVVVVGTDLPVSQFEHILTAAWDAESVQRVLIVGPDDAPDAAKMALVDPRALQAEQCCKAGWVDRFEILIASVARSLRPRPLDCEVVVVEDLDSPRDILCSYVETLGISDVHGCSGAAEALRYLITPSTRQRVVVTDIRMPEIDGCTLIEQIRRDPRLQALPIIVLTAYGTLDCLVDALAAGASGFLVKPPKRSELARELAHAFGILAGERPPRLATPEEAERVRNLLR